MFSKVSNVITVFKAFCHNPSIQGELMDSLRKKVVESSMNLITVYSAVIDERHKVIETLSKLEDTVNLIEERWNLHVTDVATYKNTKIGKAVKAIIESDSEIDSRVINKLESAIDDVNPRRIINVYKALDTGSLERRLDALQEQYEEIQGINGIAARDTEVLVKHHMQLVEMVLAERKCESTQEEYNF